MLHRPDGPTTWWGPGTRPTAPVGDVLFPSPTCLFHMHICPWTLPHTSARGRSRTIDRLNAMSTRSRRPASRLTMVDTQATKGSGYAPTPPMGGGSSASTFIRRNIQLAADGAMGALAMTDAEKARVQALLEADGPDTDGEEAEQAEGKGRMPARRDAVDSGDGGDGGDGDGGKRLFAAFGLAARELRELQLLERYISSICLTPSTQSVPFMVLLMSAQRSPLWPSCCCRHFARQPFEVASHLTVRIHCYWLSP